MNKSDEDAQAYASQVIAADMEEVGDEDVYRKLRAILRTLASISRTKL